MLFCGWSEIDRTLLQLSSERWVLCFILYLCVLLHCDASSHSRKPVTTSCLGFIVTERLTSVTESIVNRYCMWS